MNIQVQYEYSIHCFSVKQHLGCDSQIIQDAEPRAERWEGMMCTSCYIACQAMLESQLSCQQGACRSSLYVAQP